MKNFATQWFKSRNLESRKYQIESLQKTDQKIKSESLPTVLATCPGGGKTLISICYIDYYLQQNPEARVLVLTHGTAILRSQYVQNIQEYEPNFSYQLLTKTNKIGNYQVIVTLPQTINKTTNLPKFDLLIVDESHHFYFAEMIKKIIQKINPSHQLLLTGTPSLFNLKEYPIIAVAMNKLLDEGYISDVTIEIASSSYDFDVVEDYRGYELKEGLFDKTDESLDLLLEQIRKKLTSIFRSNPIMYSKILRTAGWAGTLKNLQKTLIACRNQPQAKQVAKYFTKQDINIALSISDTDDDSIEIERFKRDKDCLVLIVVNRGILGFNLPELVNVIDLSMSQNIDRIFQLLSRAVRVNPNKDQKLFFKVVPNNLTSYFEYVMTAVLCLTDEYYFTLFNGKNFLDIPIPVISKGKNKERSGESNRKEIIKSKNIKPIDMMGFPAIRFFKDILHKDGSSLNGIGYTKLSWVRNAIIRDNFKWDFENVFREAQKYETRSKWQQNSSSSYKAAMRNGWFDECTKHMIQKKRENWTFESVFREARKYKTPVEWKKNSTSYVAAQRNGWLDKCTKHMKIRKKWNFEKVLAEARKYKTPREWEKNSLSYRSAQRNGWLDKCTKHMKIRKIWTFEKVLAEAQKYKIRKDWRKNSRYSYDAAWRNNWLDQCSKHMNK